MTPHLLECVGQGRRAECAGDVGAALEWHRSVPMFAGSRHRLLLESLVAWGDELPPWVWCRFIAYLATRCEDGDTGTTVRSRLTGVVESVHQDLLEQCYVDGGDPVAVRARVYGESWAFHQSALYEAGALVAFVDEFAEGALAQHAELARRWAAAPLSGYELGESTSGLTLRVREAGAGEWLDVLDLGARAASGRWVVGRLVPSGDGDGQVFDMPPLTVPERVARDVAAAPVDERFETLVRLFVESQMPSAVFLREDCSLASDVDELALLEYATPPTELARVVQQLRSGRDEVRRAAFRVLRRAVAGDVPPADHAHVAAAALVHRADADVLRRLVRAGEAEPWLFWASRVAEPARSRLLRLAEAAR